MELIRHGYCKEDECSALDIEVHTLSPLTFTVRSSIHGHTVDYLSNAFEMCRPLFGYDRSYIRATNGGVYVCYYSDDILRRHLLRSSIEPVVIPNVHIGFNVFEQKPITVDLLDTSLFVGGSSRSGKSYLLKDLLETLSSADNCDCIVIDPKLTGLRVGSPSKYLTEPEEALHTLKEINQLLKARYEYLLSSKHDKLTDFTRELPLVVIFIDELTDLLSHPIYGSAIAEELVPILSKGLACGITVVGATQKAGNVAFGKKGTQLRDLFTKHLCFHLPTESAGATIGDFSPYKVVDLPDSGVFVLNHCQGNVIIGSSFFHVD